MKLNLSNIQILIISLLTVIMIVNIIQDQGVKRKTARIIDTIDLMKEQRVIDSMNYIHITRNVDSLKAKTAAQQAEITYMKGKLWHERQATKHLEKSLNDILVIINQRPEF